MPGFFEALDKFDKNRKPNKHFVTIDGLNIETTLEQKLQIQRTGEHAWMCQKGPNGIILCKKPIVPAEQKQTQLVKGTTGYKFYNKNPFWVEKVDDNGYVWKIK